MMGMEWGENCLQCHSLPVICGLPGATTGKNECVKVISPG